MKTDLAKGMMEGLTSLTGSKVLSRHLYNVESKTLDTAFTPLQPSRPYLLLFALGGAFAGAFLIYLGGFLKGLANGFPVFIGTLKLLGEHTSGRLSPFCDAPFSEIPDQDLETLRRTVYFLNEHKNKSGLTVALLGEKNKNFSSHLASILKLRGKKSITLDCNFNRAVATQHVPGLWQYLSEQISSLPIRS